MLPFVFSLALPLLAGVNPPTWSLREVDEFPDLRTLEAAETLDLGTRPVDALDAALHKAALRLARRAALTRAGYCRRRRLRLR